MNDIENEDNVGEDFSAPISGEGDFSIEFTPDFVFPFDDFSTPLDDVEEVAFEINPDVEPLREEDTKLTNFFLYHDVLFLIDSCYIGDSPVREEGEKDWETVVGFSDHNGCITFDTGFVRQYDDPISMIKGHLEILENPEIVFENLN